MKYQKVEEPTPNGGDYSEIYYFDDNNNIVDEEEATRCIIRECLNNGKLIQETRGICNKQS